MKERTPPTEGFISDPINQIESLIADELPPDIEKAVMILLDEVRQDYRAHTAIAMEALDLRIKLREYDDVLAARQISNLRPRP